MKNNVEILRSLCFTKEDMDNITNLGDSFSELEIDFMVEFKKIYELGLDQLKKFIDKLDEEGKDLDTYSIQYYLQVLRNGPLGSYIAGLSKDKKYFPNSPDTMGMLGNKARNPQNITVVSTDVYPLGASVDSYNRLPLFIQNSLEASLKQTEDVFRTSLYATTKNDNTMPIVDKKPKQRCDIEPDASWVMGPVGNYMLKDPYTYYAIDEISEAIFDKVKEFLGEEDFRMYKDKKQYSPFDTEKNASTAINNKIERVTGTVEWGAIGDSSAVESQTTDLLGDVFDSEDKRKAALRVSSDGGDKEYKLNTNTGQLGDE